MKSSISLQEELDRPGVGQACSGPQARALQARGGSESWPRTARSALPTYRAVHTCTPRKEKPVDMGNPGYNDYRGHMTLGGAPPTAIYQAQGWHKSECSAKVLPLDIERRVFAVDMENPG